jgi:site-specific recombinase XerD
MKKYAYKARLENVMAHTLRHSFAKSLVDANTPLDQVATLLGHENLDTTRIYTQPSGRDLAHSATGCWRDNPSELTIPFRQQEL